jgi:hypothetical protein
MQPVGLRLSELTSPSKRAKNLACFILRIAAGSGEGTRRRMGTDERMLKSGVISPSRLQQSKLRSRRASFKHTTERLELP